LWTFTDSVVGFSTFLFHYFSVHAQLAAATRIA